MSTPDSSLDAELAAALQPAFEGSIVHLHEDGTTYADRANDTYVLATNWSSDQLLPASLTGEHLLFFPADVSADEVEALAVSLWEDAGWLSPGILGLGADSSLTGPWALDREMKRNLGLPASAHSAYSVQCRRDRQAVPVGTPPEFLSPLFEGVTPVGDEYETIYNLTHIARRLGGGVRSDLGKVFEPDPDANVNLTVYAPTWLPANDMIRQLHQQFPGIRRVDGKPTTPTNLGAALKSRVTRRQIEAAGITADQLSQIMRNAERFDAAARAQTPTFETTNVPLALGVRAGADTSPYMLEVTTDCSIVIEAYQGPQLPVALRWEDWATGPVAAYEIRWEPSNPQRAYGRTVPRQLRIERMNATTEIEAIAGNLLSRVDGAAIDESGFIVGF